METTLLAGVDQVQTRAYLAGSSSAKRRLPATSGTMPTHGPLFVALLIASIVLVAALTFLRALCVGPVAEHYLM